MTRAVEGPSRFASILRQELLNGCPVYLEGRPANTASGHAWVADGFDENGLFHMNLAGRGKAMLIIRSPISVCHKPVVNFRVSPWPLTVP